MMKTIEVKIREWDDIEQDFDLNEDSDIEYTEDFLKRRESLYGKIVKLHFDEDTNIWYETYTGDCWYIPKDMVESEYKHLMEIA